MATMRPIRMSVAEWVKAVRRALGFTSQEAFSERLHRGRSAVAKWESGVQSPNIDSFRRLWMMAPVQLRQVAPQAIEGLGISDVDLPPEEAQPPARTFSKEALAVAEEIDTIEDPILRKHARNAALTAIEHAQQPPKPNNNNGQ